MKKFILLMIMLAVGMILAFTLAGCASDDAVAEDVPEDEEEVLEDGEASENSVEEETEGPEIAVIDSGTKIYDVPTPLLETAITYEDFAQFYLLRDDFVYCLNNATKGRLSALDDYDVGVAMAGGEEYGLYCHSFELPDGRAGFFQYTVGNASSTPPIKRSNDTIIVTTTGEVPKIRLYKLNIYGTGVPIYKEKDSDDFEVFYDNTSWSAVDVKVMDQSNEVDDYYNLEYLKEYQITWNKGTQSQAVSMKARALVFAYQPSYNLVGGAFDFDYEVEALLNEEGYAEYDLSAVEPGIYRIGSSIGNQMEGVVIIR